MCSAANRPNEDRFFKSELQDFVPPRPTENIESQQKQLKEKIEHSFYKLLKKFEKTLHEELDWKDISVYTGVSGYVLLYFFLSENFNDDKYLQTASQLNLKSLQLMKRKRVSFLCGDSGPLALGAIIFEKQQDFGNVEKCIIELSDMQESILNLRSDLPDELLYGRVGYLYALLLINKKVSSRKIDPKLIRSVIVAILESGQRSSRQRNLRVPLAYEWHQKNYLGAAHGVCGILTLLLQDQARVHLTERELHDVIRPTIDNLTHFVYKSGNLASSEGSSSGDRLVHWCHGATAAVYMFATAYKTFRDEKYLHYAVRASDVVWERGLLRKGYGLCHGTAGNGYAFLFMYQTTGDPKYLHRAHQFGLWCRDYGKHGCDTPDRPWSLFEGLAGTVHFMADLLNPAEAKFPAFIL